MRTERVCRLEETPRTGPHEAPGCVLFKPLFETCRGARSARTPSEDQVSARLIFISLAVRLLLWRTIPGISFLSLCVLFEITYKASQRDSSNFQLSDLLQEHYCLDIQFVVFLKNPARGFHASLSIYPFCEKLVRSFCTKLSRTPTSSDFLSSA